MTRLWNCFCDMHPLCECPVHDNGERPDRMRGQFFSIDVLRDGVWVDCGEGPWDSYKQALEFAEAEVGVEYRIVD